ncbi:hypothetical protein NDU88_005037 [Pleurodeles waltl]|uniref:Uncharacterized protein n=1 Tax=Pleurodeles waltl TaxID=8319 RepID=A0AAV7V2T1_PLEWA|nr:hypothetical protein NDU88_005037 [Pleurodeles waltl]
MCDFKGEESGGATEPSQSRRSCRSRGTPYLSPQQTTRSQLFTVTPKSYVLEFHNRGLRLFRGPAPYISEAGPSDPTAEAPCGRVEGSTLMSPAVRGAQESGGRSRGSHKGRGRAGQAALSQQAALSHCGHLCAQQHLGPDAHRSALHSAAGGRCWTTPVQAEVTPAAQGEEDGESEADAAPWSSKALPQNAPHATKGEAGTGSVTSVTSVACKRAVATALTYSQSSSLIRLFQECFVPSSLRLSASPFLLSPLCFPQHLSAPVLQDAAVRCGAAIRRVSPPPQHSSVA